MRFLFFLSFSFSFLVLRPCALAQDYASEELALIGNLIDQRNYHNYYSIKDPRTGIIEHLGLPLFAQDTEYPYNLVLRFVERYSLYAQLINKEELSRKLKEDNVEINIPIHESLESVDNVTIDSGENYIRVTLDNGFMSFPKEFSLIIGRNKKELDDFFYKDLMNFNKKFVADEKHYDIDCDMQYSVKKDSIIQEKGDTYLIKELNNDRYYSMIEDKKSYLYDDRYLPQTLSNICQQFVKGDFCLEIKQNIYGYQKKLYNIPFDVFTEYCKSQGCKIYVGIEKVSEDGIQAIVVYRNDIFAYNHLLYVNVDIDTIKNRKGTISSTLNCYIPTHNVKKML